jgi:hypothetical protein
LAAEREQLELLELLPELSEEEELSAFFLYVSKL